MADATQAGRDLNLRAGVENPALGDIVFETGGVERARISAAGVASGLLSGIGVLFDRTLAVDTASIDTGVNGIPAGYALLDVICSVKSTVAIAVTTSAVGLVLNGDQGANYFYQDITGINTVVTAGNNFAGVDNLMRINAPGSSFGANQVAIAKATFHGYDSAFIKTALLHHALFDNTAAANGRARITAGTWNSAAVINQIALWARPASGGVLGAGSRMTIIGYR